MTDFGDSALLIPLAVAMLLWLVLGDRRSTVWWGAAVGFCVGVTALLKIFFYGCPPASDMHSPSGHTGFSVLVYGAIALVTAIRVTGPRRMFTIVFGASLILAIAASRLILQAHSFPEVSLGLAIGLVSLTMFGRIYMKSPNAQVWPLLISSGILIALLHGQELHAEEFLHGVTNYLGVHCS